MNFAHELQLQIYFLFYLVWLVWEKYNVQKYYYELVKKLKKLTIKDLVYFIPVISIWFLIVFTLQGSLINKLILSVILYLFFVHYVILFTFFHSYKDILFFITFGSILALYLSFNFYLYNFIIIGGVSFIGFVLNNWHNKYKNQLLIFLITLWTIYDICYVWFFNFVQVIHDKTHIIPLSIQFGNSSLGSADLLLVSIIVAFLRELRIAVIYSLVVFITNVLFTFYPIHQQINYFPLLTIWGPISIIFIVLEKYFMKATNTFFS